MCISLRFRREVKKSLGFGHKKGSPLASFFRKNEKRIN